MATNNYSKITPEIMRLAEICQSNAIDPMLYTKYDVKRGLRDLQTVKPYIPSLHAKSLWQ